MEGLGVIRPALIPKKFDKQSTGGLAIGDELDTIVAAFLSNFAIVLRIDAATERHHSWTMKWAEQLYEPLRVELTHFEGFYELDQLFGRTLQLRCGFFARSDAVQEQLACIDRVKLRLQDGRIFVFAEQPQLRHVNLAGWVVLIAKVAVRAEREEVLKIIVRRVLVDVVHVWPITSANSAAVVILVEEGVLDLLWNRFACGHCLA